MSGSFSSAATMHESLSIPHDRDVTVYLEDLANRLKDLDSKDQKNDEQHWMLINRVPAYAASAEQHIAEQQSRIQELENLSTTDELTGLANRRALRDFMHRTISSARRYNEQGVLAFLDLENFKAINDTHGHDAGDRMLQKLAEILVTNLRSTDFVARLGGDEFVFVLQKADQKQAIARAHKIRELISQCSINAPRSQIKISASMGLAIYDAQSTFESVMRAADEAMYKDKTARKALV
jgi:diguanylate cyclase (GGDEF)-like protein